MHEKFIVPFKTPLDYFVEALDGNPDNIDIFPQIQQKTLNWDKYDCDLHIYPYVKAKAGILSMGCFNKCKFCPTAELHKGKVYFGNPEVILPYYKNDNVHFMDEDFGNNNMKQVLPLLLKYRIKWTAMMTNKRFKSILSEYGEKYLFDCGLRCVEIGLENVSLMMKVKREVKSNLISIYYLNMTCLPMETKETIRENAEWMKCRSVKHLIHFNNGVWYAPGQFYYPYQQTIVDGILLQSKYARTRPTYIPNSLLKEDYCIKNIEKVNYYNQLVYGIKLYPNKRNGNIFEFIKTGADCALWLIEGIRCGGIV